jgi:hypothetical protein
MIQIARDCLLYSLAVILGFHSGILFGGFSLIKLGVKTVNVSYVESG